MFFSLWSCQFVVSRHLWKTYIFTKCHEISWLQNLLITDSKDYLFSWGVLKPDMISYGRGNAEHRRSLMTIQAQAAKWTKNNVHLSSWLMVLFINGWIYAYKYIYIYGWINSYIPVSSFIIMTPIFLGTLRFIGGSNTWPDCPAWKGKETGTFTGGPHLWVSCRKRQSCPKGSPELVPHLH